MKPCKEAFLRSQCAWAQCAARVCPHCKPFSFAALYTRMGFFYNFVEINLAWPLKSCGGQFFFRFVRSPEVLNIENSHMKVNKLKLPYISIWYFFWLQIAHWFQKCKNFVVWRSISTTGGQIRSKYMKFSNFANFW
jgi:hypothetical protein